MNLEKLCIQVQTLVHSTGEMILNERKSFDRSQVEIKGLHDYVTHIDKLAEENLVAGLEILIPESGFIAEEGTSTKKGENYNWIIDPID